MTSEIMTSSDLIASTTLLLFRPHLGEVPLLFLHYFSLFFVNGRLVSWSSTTSTISSTMTNFVEFITCHFSTFTCISVAPFIHPQFVVYCWMSIIFMDHVDWCRKLPSSGTRFLQRRLVTSCSHSTILHFMSICVAIVVIPIYSSFIKMRYVLLCCMAIEIVIVVVQQVLFT